MSPAPLSLIDLGSTLLSRQTKTLASHTRVQVSEQYLKLGVAVQVIVFGHVAPTGLDGGSALL